MVISGKAITCTIIIIIITIRRHPLLLLQRVLSRSDWRPSQGRLHSSCSTHTHSKAKQSKKDLHENIRKTCYRLPPLVSYSARPLFLYFAFIPSFTTESESSLTEEERVYSSQHNSPICLFRSCVCVRRVLYCNSTKKKQDKNIIIFQVRSGAEHIQKNAVGLNFFFLVIWMMERFF